jgi:hypothetical protein
MTPEQTEANGRWLLPALESIAGSSTPLAHDAERHTVRLRFALARVRELREHLAARNGPMDAGRLDVAQAILATHYRRASDFVGSMTAPEVTAIPSAAMAPANRSGAAHAPAVTSGRIVTENVEPKIERIAA